MLGIPQIGESPTQGRLISFDFTESTLLYSAGDEVSLQLHGIVPSVQIDAVSVIWRLNGQSLPTGASLSALRKLTTHISQSLEIENPTFQHSGVYEALLYSYVYTYFRQCSCDDRYPQFISNTIGSSIMLGKATLHLKYFGKLHYALRITFSKGPVYNFLCLDPITFQESINSYVYHSSNNASCFVMW